MANEIMKEIKTRIALKTLDLAGWEAIKDTYKPLKGEVCVCEIPSGNVLTANSVTPPTVLFKVGDGSHFWSELNWASALAADVYSWAKKSQDEFIEWVNTVVEHPAAPKITTGSENGTIAVDGADVAVKGLGSAAYTESGAYATSEQGTKADNAAAAIATYGDIVTHNVAEFATKEQGDKADSAVQSVTLAGGTNDGTLKLTIDGEAVDNIAVTGLQDAAYTTVKALNATAKGYADDVQDNLTAYETAHKDDYTNTEIDELIQGAKDYADDANTEYHVEYDSDNKKIKLVAGADASKMEIDATDFIKDGMIQSVTLSEDGLNLVITWNTDADKGENNVTTIPLTGLVDIYTGVAGDRVTVTVTSDDKISADIVAGSISKNYLDISVQTSLGKADTALQSHQTLEHLATKEALEDVVDGTTPVAKAAKATDAEKLGGQLPAYYATKESVDAIPGAIDSKITAYDASKNFGDIITHNVAEFATSAQGGKADTALQRIATTENHGLKVSAKENGVQNIDIDTDVIFVLDCNW